MSHRSTPPETAARTRRSVTSVPPLRRPLALRAAARVQNGGQGGVRAGRRRRMLGVRGGDRKVDGAGDANGEGSGVADV